MLYFVLYCYIYTLYRRICHVSMGTERANRVIRYCNTSPICGRSVKYHCMSGSILHFNQRQSGISTLHICYILRNIAIYLIYTLESMVKITIIQRYIQANKDYFCYISCNIAIISRYIILSCGMNDKNIIKYGNRQQYD